jgi:hypothetical protein
VPDDERRHEHVGKTIDDVVQCGAVELRQALFDVREAREHPVGGVDHGGETQPAKASR